MLYTALTPPGLWIVLGVSLALSIPVYLKRNAIKRWLRSLTLIEIAVGPFTFAPPDHPSISSESKSSEEEEPSMLSEQEIAALVRKYIKIDGDGNVVGDSNNVNILKVGEQSYEIHIGTVIITRERDELKDLLKPSGKTVTTPPPRTPPPLSAPQTELRQNSKFQQIVRWGKKDKARLFIGAGVSAAVGMPSTAQLINALRAEARAYGTLIPADISFPEAAGEIEKIAGRSSLVDLLRHEFDDAALPMQPPAYERGAYRFIPYLPNLNRLVLTTNWDQLLKRAFETAGKPAREVWKNTQLAGISTTDQVVLKLHGDFSDAESMVITEVDYKIAESRIREQTTGTLWGYTASLLAQYSFIFVGYSLGDPTMRLLQRMVRSATETWHNGIPHYFVTPFADEARAAEQWGDVRAVVASPEEFFAALLEALQEGVRDE